MLAWAGSRWDFPKTYLAYASVKGLFVNLLSKTLRRKYLPAHGLPKYTFPAVPEAASAAREIVFLSKTTSMPVSHWE